MAQVRSHESLFHTMSDLLGSLAENDSFSLIVHSKQKPIMSWRFGAKKST